MKSIIIALSLTLSATAMADFSGNWFGKGILVEPSGAQSVCPEMNLILSQTPEYFKIKYGQFNCGQYFFNFSMFKLDIKNGLLVSDGVAVGTIDQNTLHAEQIDPQSNVKMVYDAKVKESVMIYKQVGYDSQGKRIISIEAQFSNK